MAQQYSAISECGGIHHLIWPKVYLGWPASPTAFASPALETGKCGAFGLVRPYSRHHRASRWSDSARWSGQRVGRAWPWVDVRPTPRGGQPMGKGACNARSVGARLPKCPVLVADFSFYVRH